MRHLTDLVRSACAWLKVDSEKGVAAIEYGLLAALIALAIITAVTLVGTSISDLFNAVAKQLTKAAG
jgi:pilus assembly protein Flp/PilA